jgi:hypothetical protein
MTFHYFGKEKYENVTLPLAYFDGVIPLINKPSNARNSKHCDISFFMFFL